MLPETCRVIIPINVEFSASVGCIHKEFDTMDGHMILKLLNYWLDVSIVVRPERD